MTSNSKVVIVTGAGTGIGDAATEMTQRMASGIVQANGELGFSKTVPGCLRHPWLGT